MWATGVRHAHSRAPVPKAWYRVRGSHSAFVESFITMIVSQSTVQIEKPLIIEKVEHRNGAF